MIVDLLFWFYVLVCGYVMADWYFSYPGVCKDLDETPDAVDRVLYSILFGVGWPIVFLATIVAFIRQPRRPE